MITVYKKKLKAARTALFSAVGIAAAFLLFQFVFAHMGGVFRPDYQRKPLPLGDSMTEADYEEIFLQTGLSRTAVDYYMESGNERRLYEWQDALFSEKELCCLPLLSLFTRTDALYRNGERFISPPLDFMEEGDLLITLSTHSCGWRHGHAAIAIDGGRVVESRSIGSCSCISGADSWRYYSNYILLRVEADKSAARRAARLAEEELCGVPYRLSAGIFGEKCGGTGASCGYLVWRAWYGAGVDLDSDGGRVVTPADLLNSDKVEIICVFGLDPSDFAKLCG